MDKLDNPLFVVGPLRSGTTLLRLILDQHSQINCFGEFETAVSQCTTNGWPDLHSFYDFIKTDRQAQAYGFQVDESLDYPDLVRSWLKQMDSRKEATYIGASVHSRIDMLPALWPQGKFIHLIRDPRDVAKSCIGMGWVGNVYEGARYWLSAESQWDLLSKTVPKESRYEICYEKLVAEPDQEICKLCQFLGLAYEANMLDLENTTYSRPDKAFAEQWRRKQSLRQIGWVESRCRELMVARGYALETGGKPLSYVMRVYLKIHDRFFRSLFNIKRYGLVFSFLYGSARVLRLGKLRQALQIRKNEIEAKYLR